MPEPNPSFPRIDYIAAARVAIANLQLEHPDCNIIVVASQLGEVDNHLLAQEVEGIDVIVAGNHDLYESGDEYHPYPTVLTGPTGYPIHLVGAGHYGNRIGMLKVIFDTDGIITSFDDEQSDTYKMDLTFNETVGAYVPDSGDYQYGSDSFNTWDMVRAEYVEVEVFKETLVGKTNVALDGSRGGLKHEELGSGASCITQDICSPSGVHECSLTWDDISNKCSSDKYAGFCCTQADYCCAPDTFWEVFGCRHSDCPLGRVSTDALLVNCDDCDLAIMNGGGIRSSLDIGNITFGELISVFPFQNTIATFQIRGLDLKER